MAPIKPFTAGLCVAAFLTAWHAAWALLVALNWAQPLMDLVFRLHFISPPFRVGAFDAPTAGLLLLLVSTIGFLIGAGLALIWNGLARARD